MISEAFKNLVLEFICTSRELEKFSNGGIEESHEKIIKNEIKDMYNLLNNNRDLFLSKEGKDE